MPRGSRSEDLQHGTRDLRRGCHGEDVLALQKQLKEKGYYSGDLDGDFGPMTEAAVKAFQQANGLYVDGIVGPITRGVLQAKEEPAEEPENVIKSARVALQAGYGTVEVARWGNHKFIISNTEIRSFKDFQITGSADIDKSDENDQGYYSYQGAQPVEISMTAVLNAFVGNSDVRSQAETFVDEARRGKSDYLYIGGKKVFTFTLILSNAKVSKVEFAPDMTWISANVDLTFKQSSGEGLGMKGTSTSDSSGSSSGSGSYGSSGGGGSSGYSGGSSSKVSVKQTSVTATERATSVINNTAAAVNRVTSFASSTVKSVLGINVSSTASTVAKGVTATSALTSALNAISNIKSTVTKATSSLTKSSK